VPMPRMAGSFNRDPAGSAGSGAASAPNAGSGPIGGGSARSGGAPSTSRGAASSGSATTHRPSGAKPSNGSAGNGGNGARFSDDLAILERAGVMPKFASGPSGRSDQFASFQVDAPCCDNCGAITVRNGNCYLCHNCGNSMGCS